MGLEFTQKGESYSARTVPLLNSNKSPTSYLAGSEVILEDPGLRSSSTFPEIIGQIFPITPHYNTRIRILVYFITIT